MSLNEIPRDNYKPCWVPIDDDFIVWEGKWKSSNFSGVYGNIAVPLKRINTGEYSASASISYEGCYNGGKKLTFPIQVSATEIESLNKRDVTYLEFHGNIGNQRIEYSISEYKTDRIIGIYKSYDPNDAGTIELVPTKEKRIDYGERPTWCVIC